MVNLTGMIKWNSSLTGSLNIFQLKNVDWQISDQKKQVQLMGTEHFENSEILDHLRTWVKIALNNLLTFCALFG